MQAEKENAKKQYNIQGQQNNYKRYNIHVVEISGEEREKGAEEIFKVIVAETSDTTSQICIQKESTS